MTVQNTQARISAFSNVAFSTALILLAIASIVNIDRVGAFSDLWWSLKYLSPFFFAFLVSVVIILISWSNHRSISRFIDTSSVRFKYANGLLLLTIIALPFSTAFLAEYGLTKLAGTSVALYSFINCVQAIARTVLMRTALYSSLVNDNGTTETIRQSCKKSSYTIFVYAICTVLAFWLPFAVAIIIALTWIAWVVSGLNITAEN